MTSWKKTVLCGAVSSFLLGSALDASAGLILTFSNGTAVAAKPGACSGIAWTAGAEFRMCDTSGAALGGGFPVQKDTIVGGETFTFNDAGVMTGVTGTPTNPGATFGGSAAPSAGTNATWQQGASFFGPIFNFLAPISGSLAGTAYGTASYIGGAPTAGANVSFIFAPVMEAQWGGTWFPLGQFGGAGVTFTADISNVATVGNSTTFDFHLYANELIDGAEDPGAAGFSGWTAQWHMQGSGVYGDTTAPTVSSIVPADGATGVSTSLAAIDVTFSEPMDTSTVVAGSITLSGGETVGAPTAYNQDKTFRFPITSAPLSNSTAYTVTFNAGPRDKSSNAVTLPAAKTFTTGTTADTTAPTVTTRSPASGATSVATNAAIVVTFSEAMDPATAGAITITGPSGSVSGSVTLNSAQTVFTFQPSASLADGTQYTVTVSSATAEDTSATNLATDDTWLFTTAGAGQVIDRKIESDGKGNGFLAGCTMNPHAKFDPSLLAMLLGSFGFLIWRRRRGN